MLFKIEIIEAEPGEEFIYENPYSHSDVLLSSTKEGLEVENTAWLLLPREAVNFRLEIGAVLYGKTKLRPVE